MTLAQLLNREVTIIRRTASGTIDDYGNDIPGETIVETVGEVQQRQRTERGDQGEVSSTDWVLFLPIDTEIDTGDAVEIDGVTYELVGAPWNADSGSPAVHHMEASVRRVAGEEIGS